MDTQEVDAPGYFRDTDELRSPTIAKNIGPQVAARDLSTSSYLDRRPVLGIEQHAVLEPVRDGLLLESRPLHQFSQASGEGSLAASGSTDGATECDNVRFLHDARRYTSFLVGVNKASCLTNNKGPCTVIQMPVPKEKERPKTQPRKRAKRVAVTGPDGLTFGQRVQKLMNERDVGQTKLAKMCSDFYRTYVPEAEDLVQQQHIFNVVSGQDSAWCMPLIAAVFDVRELWLQIGIGPKERR